MQKARGLALLSLLLVGSVADATPEDEPIVAEQEVQDDTIERLNLELEASKLRLAEILEQSQLEAVQEMAQVEPAMELPPPAAQPVYIEPQPTPPPCTYAAPCYPCCIEASSCCWPCARWCAGVHALYWCLNSNNLVYGTTEISEDIGFTNITRKFIDLEPCYDWGVKAELCYQCSGCTTLWASYYWLEWRENSAIGAPDNGTLTSFLDIDAQRATAREQYRLNEANIGMRHQLLCACGARLHAIAGGRYFNLDNPRCVLAFDDAEVSTARIRHQLWGLGFFGGIDFDWTLCRGFGLVGQLDVGAVFGQRQFDQRFFVDSTADSSLNRNFDANVTAVPFVDAVAGLRYTQCCGCGRLTVEAVFEQRYYADALDDVQMVRTNGENDGNPALLYPGLRPIAFGGLRFGVQYAY